MLKDKHLEGNEELLGADIPLNLTESEYKGTLLARLFFLLNYEMKHVPLNAFYGICCKQASSLIIS